MRAIYAIMGCYKRHKVKAHFWEVERRFASVRSMPDHGKSVEWPAPPAALAQFHRITTTLHRRSGNAPNSFCVTVSLVVLSELQQSPRTSP